MTIFVTRRIPDAGLDRLTAAGVDVVIGQDDEERGLARSAVVEGVANCDVLLCLLTEAIDREVLTAGAGRLRGIATMAVGYDNIDVDAATSLGIPVSNTPGVLTEATADLTWALLMAVSRRIVEAHRYTVDGRFALWGPNLLVGADVGPGPDGSRHVLGIVGFGRIGAAVARRASGFSLDVLAYNPRNRAAIDDSGWARFADFDELLARSDFVSLHTPLTAETRHLIGARELRRMKSSAFLINTARGPVVDERALVEALREGEIAGAGLDVYENEPELAPGLAELPKVVLLPHIASASRETRDRMAIVAATNALAHYRRQPAPNAVNPEVYE